MKTRIHRGRYGELPADLFRRMDAYTSDSTVVIHGNRDNKRRVDRAYGSGSLAVIDSLPGVLTARHVWEMLRDQEEVALISFSIVGYTHFICEKKEYLRAFYPKNGVDICFLQIPAATAGTIRAHRTFVHLTKERKPELSSMMGRVAVSVGFPYEIQTKEERRDHILRYYTHLTGHSKYDEDWDEISLEYSLANSSGPIPHSLRGMSGGGVWCFRTYVDGATGNHTFNNSETRLIGVNFYETAPEDGIRQIRAIGPHSLYEGLTRLVTGRG